MDKADNFFNPAKPAEFEEAIANSDQLDTSELIADIFKLVSVQATNNEFQITITQNNEPVYLTLTQTHDGDVVLFYYINKNLEDLYSSNTILVPGVVVNAHEVTDFATFEEELQKIVASQLLTRKIFSIELSDVKIQMNGEFEYMFDFTTPYEGVKSMYAELSSDYTSAVAYIVFEDGTAGWYKGSLS